MTQKDSRLYAKFTLDFCDHPKIRPLTPEVKWAFVEMVLYSRRMMTDGFLSKSLALAMWGASTCLALATNDAEKPSLIELENGYQIHDFEDHQSTSAEIDALRETRRAAGQKGGKASARAKAKQVLQQNGSKSNPETETETHTTTANAVVESPRKRAHRLPDDWQPHRDVIDQMQTEHPGVDLRAETAKFCDYWRAKSGKDATKLDWDATWRNWIRRAAEQRPRGSGPRVAASDVAFAAAQALKNHTPSAGLELE